MADKGGEQTKFPQECKLCKKKLINEKELIEHLKSAKHLQKSDTTIDLSKTPQIYPHICTLCNKKCNNSKDYLEHYKSVKHLKKKIGSTSVESHVDVQEQSREQMEGAEQKIINPVASHEEIKDIGIYFSCKFCGIECFDEELISAHLTSQEHRENTAAKKPFPTTASKKPIPFFPGEQYPQAAILIPPKHENKGQHPQTHDVLQSGDAKPKGSSSNIDIGLEFLSQGPSSPKPVKGISPSRGIPTEMIPRNVQSSDPDSQSERTDKSLQAGTSTNQTLKVVTPELKGLEKKAKPQSTPITQKEAIHVCHQCNRACNGRTQLEEHKRSERHAYYVKLFQPGIKWEYRAPPDGLKDDYNFCPNPSQCPNGDDCFEAHSSEELEEWKKRFHLRPMGRKQDKQLGRTLMKEFINSKYPQEILLNSPRLEKYGIVVKLNDGNTNVVKCKKDLNIQWRYNVTIESDNVFLKRAVLLKNAHGFEKPNVIQNDETQKNVSVDVSFSSEFYGTFEEWIGFEFECKEKADSAAEVIKPCLLRKLHVHVQAVTDYQAGANNQEISAKKHEKWDTENRNVSFLAPRGLVLPFEWKKIDLETRGVDYKENMLQFLANERQSRLKVLSDLTTTMTVELYEDKEKDSYQIEMALDGKYYEDIMRVKAGDLMAWVAPLNTTPEDTVYEMLQDKAVDLPSSEDEGYGQKIRWQISEECFLALQNSKQDLPTNSESKATNQEMQADSKHSEISENAVDIEVQFQIDEVWFAKLADAVESLDQDDIKTFLTPDIGRLGTIKELEDDHAFRALVKDFQKDKGPNPNQKKILRWLWHGEALMNNKMLPILPPLILYGPFGTGKTWTIANGARFLSKKAGNTRILLCTPNEASADIYTTTYSECIKQGKRLYPAGQKVKEGQENMCFQFQGKTIIPSKEQLKKSKIIVTSLDMCHLLKQKEMKGQFTHIIIDEASQCLEAETLMALNLASETTLVMLAGDIHQVEPYIVGKKRQVEPVLMRRLFLLYEKVPSLRLLLSDNYRTEKNILKFLAQNFYGGQSLGMKQEKTAECTWKPLNFYVVTGNMQGDGNSFFNKEEVEQVLETLRDFDAKYAKIWRKEDRAVVAVICEHTSQAWRIKKAIGKMKSDSPLSSCKVLVDLVENIQGKEYDAVVISTVYSGRQRRTTGFLEDKKLLNTSISRARFAVGIVGNPITLCSYGKCQDVWRNYLQAAKELKGLQPVHFDLDFEKEQAIETEIETKMECGLSVITDSSDSGYNSGSFSGSDTGTPAGSEYEFEQKNDLAFDRALREDIETSQTAPENLDVWDDDKKKEGASSIDRSYNIFEGKTNWKDDRPLFSAADAELDEENLDYGTIQRDFLRKEEGPLLYNMKKQELKELLQKSHHIEGILHIDSPHQAHCIPCGPADNITRVEIYGRKNCMYAFNEDRVVVQVLGEDRATDNDGGEVIHYGQVKGVLKYRHAMKYIRYICLIDEYDPSLMKPICKSVPKIIIFSDSVRTRKKMTMDNAKVNIYCHREMRNYGRLKKKEHKIVSRLQRDKMLFVVCLLKWKKDNGYPFGIAVHTFTPPRMDPRYLETDSLSILREQYHIPENYRDDTDRQVQHTLEQAISDTGLRKDFMNLDTITMAPDGTDIHNRAISILQEKDESFKLWFHVADTTVFMKKGDPVDNEAASRGMTFHIPPQNPVQMLKPALSATMSLSKGREEQRVITIEFKFKKDYTLEHPPTWKDIRLGVIEVTENWPFSKMEPLLKGFEKDKKYGEEDANLWHFYQIARLLKREKVELGPKLFWHDDSTNEHKLANEILAELCSLANKTIGRLLVEVKPEHTPLVTQMPPRECDLKQWEQTFWETIKMSNKYQNMDKEPQKSKRGPNALEVVVCKEFVDFLYQTVRAPIPDKQLIEKIMNMEQDQPSFLIAANQWFEIQSPVSIVMSSDISQEKIMHYQECSKEYTYFASPLNRYLDIFVQRLVRGHLEGKDDTYSPKDTRYICDSFDSVNSRGKKLKRAVQLLKHVKELVNEPLNMLAVVEKNDDRNISLAAGSMYYIPPKYKVLKTNCIGLNDLPKPDIEQKAAGGAKQNVTSDVMMYSWKERIHNYTERGGFEPRVRPVKLYPNRHSMTLSGVKWSEFITNIAEKDWSEATLKLRSLKTDYSKKEAKLMVGYVDDVSSERTERPKDRAHHSYFALDLKPNSILQVQYHTEYSNCLLVPTPNVLTLTPTYSVCLEHRSNPVQCFSTLAERSIRNRYRDMTSYCQDWGRLLSMESVVSAMQDAASFTIHNVEVEWLFTDDGVLGNIELEKSFCYQRDLYFQYVLEIIEKDGKEKVIVDGDEDDSPDEYEEEETQRKASFLQDVFGYICVQVKETNMDMDQVEDDGESEDDGFDENDKGEIHKELNMNKKPPIFTVHGIVTSLKLYLTDKKYKWEFKVVPPTPVWLNRFKTFKTTKASVEIYEKGLTHRRMYKALDETHNAPDLITSLAMQKNPGSTTIPFKENIEIEFKPLNTPNESQRQAVHYALRNKITLIQGPPGTGKTETGVRLAYLFSQINEIRTTENDTPKKWVLYCGPSNRSVNVVTKYLLKNLVKKMPEGVHRPKILRIYSKSIEVLDKDYRFPSGYMKKQKRRAKYEDKADPEINEVALHRMIREPGTPFWADIQRFNDILKRKDDLLDDDLMKEYKKVIKDATDYFIQRHDILLVTCIGSGSKLMKDLKGQIGQCIVDECGMCVEPETLIPLITTDPDQMILIGDHKQLRPIVLDRTAAEMGMGRSLFERCATNDEFPIHMLKIQYRMHPSICEFPSAQFYDSHLEAGTNTRWDVEPKLMPEWQQTLTKDTRTIFCHTAGPRFEGIQAVKSDTGNEMSKFNHDELIHVERILKAMVYRYKVKPKDIAFLTPYRAQSNILKDEFKDKIDLKDITKETIVSSQGGEWDFIVLSTVRSMPKHRIIPGPTLGWCKGAMGTVIDPHQINVALTRARKGLFIIGNENLLKCWDPWKSLLENYKERLCYRLAADVMSTVPLPATVRDPAFKEDKEDPADLFHKTEQEKWAEDIPPRFQKKQKELLSIARKNRERNIFGPEENQSNEEHKQAPVRRRRRQRMVNKEESNIIRELLRYIYIGAVSWRDGKLNIFVREGKEKGMEPVIAEVYDKAFTISTYYETSCSVEEFHAGAKIHVKDDFGGSKTLTFFDHNTNENFGTLGGFLWRKEEKDEIGETVYALTAGHVVNFDQTGTKQKIYIETEGGDDHVPLGEVSVNLRDITHEEASLDAALIEVFPSTVKCLQNIPDNEWSNKTEIYGDAERPQWKSLSGKQVKKYGAKTGLTEGIILDTKFIVESNLAKDEKIKLMKKNDDLYRKKAEPDPQESDDVEYVVCYKEGEDFTEPGDSGSIVHLKYGPALSLHYKGITDYSYKGKKLSKVSLSLPLIDILEEIEIQMDFPTNLYPWSPSWSVCGSFQDRLQDADLGISSQEASQTVKAMDDSILTHGGCLSRDHISRDDASSKKELKLPTQISKDSGYQSEKTSPGESKDVILLTPEKEIQLSTEQKDNLDDNGNQVSLQADSTHEDTGNCKCNPNRKLFPDDAEKKQ